MQDGFPRKTRRFERFGAAVLTVHKQPQYGYSQGGETRKGSPARRAAKNADQQRTNPAGEKLAGYTEEFAQGFGPDFGGSFVPGFGNIKERR